MLRSFTTPTSSTLVEPRAVSGWTVGFKFKLHIPQDALPPKVDRWMLIPCEGLPLWSVPVPWGYWAHQWYLLENNSSQIYQTSHCWYSTLVCPVFGRPLAWITWHIWSPCAIVQVTYDFAVFVKECMGLYSSVRASRGLPSGTENTLFPWGVLHQSTTYACDLDNWICHLSFTLQQEK